jgi:hypothetical protein
MDICVPYTHWILCLPMVGVFLPRKQKQELSAARVSLAVRMPTGEQALALTGFFVRRFPNGVYEGDILGGKMQGRGR